LTAYQHPCRHRRAEEYIQRGGTEIAGLQRQRLPMRATPTPIRFLAKSHSCSRPLPSGTGCLRTGGSRRTATSSPLDRRADCRQAFC
jgi:hypothetical protein